MEPTTPVESTVQKMTTANGYVIEYRTRMKFGDYSQIRKTIARYMKVNAKGASQDMPLEAILEANDIAVKFLLISLKDKDGSVLSNTLEYINDNLDPIDGSEIMQTIQSVWLAEFARIEKKLQSQTNQ